MSSGGSASVREMAENARGHFLVIRSDAGQLSGN
jgi:hypothetical protein